MTDHRAPLAESSAFPPEARFQVTEPKSVVEDNLVSFPDVSYQELLPETVCSESEQEEPGQSPEEYTPVDTVAHAARAESARPVPDTTRRFEPVESDFVSLRQRWVLTTGAVHELSWRPNMPKEPLPSQLKGNGSSS